MDDWKSKVKMRLPVLALLVVTIVFWSLYDRYEPVGPMLLESPTLSDVTRSTGDVSESGGRFVLNVSESGRRVDVRFRLPDATHYESIRVRARIKVEEVVAGEYAWRCARLVFAQYDADRKWMPGRHGLMGMSGTTGWKVYEKAFEMFPDAAYAEVALQQLGSSGLAEFEHIEAQPVRVRASFVWWRILFAGGWLVAAVYYFPRCRLHRRRLKMLILLNVLVILVGALMPSEWISDNTGKAKAAWAKVAQPVPVKTDVPPREKPTTQQERDTQQMGRFNKVVGDAHRTGHFILFASLCFLVYLSAALEQQRSVYYFKVGFDVLLFAAVTESLQFLTLDRTAGMIDLLIDVYGMAVAFVLFLAVLPLVRRRQGAVALKTG